MTYLCGKGIWLAHSYDLDRSVEMATSTGATHLLVKVGHGPHYFPETTREMVQRVRTLGLTPLAWVHATNRAPQAAQKTIVEALGKNYEFVIIHVSPGDLTGSQAHLLTEALINVEIPRDRIFLASPPLAYMMDQTVIETLVPVCQGGWMPLCFATWNADASHVIDRDVYHGLGDLSLIWDKTPDIYPVLSPISGEDGESTLPEDFIPWVEGIARHGVDFFSVYHAANTEKALWPMLEAVNLACLETGERTPVTETPDSTPLNPVPQPVYITVKTSDSVWGIISRHGLTREQFWAWNAHLWESRGLPRDPDYMQEGWRIRVK
jgi:hypothetical protein